MDKSVLDIVSILELLIKWIHYQWACPFIQKSTKRAIGRVRIRIKRSQTPKSS